MSQKNILYAAILAASAFLALGTLSANIAMAQTAPSLEIKIWAKNTLIAKENWEKIIAAQPGNIVEFKIEVKNIGENVQKNVQIASVLSPKLSYRGNLKVENAASSLDPLKGISFYEIKAGETKAITFDAQVAQESAFKAGQNELISNAFVKSDKFPIVDFAKINVWKKGILGGETKPTTPTSLSTGYGDKFADFIFIPFTLALGALFIFRKQLALASGKWDNISCAADKAISEKNLLKKIESLKK